jgi:hypothetical protein
VVPGDERNSLLPSATPGLDDIYLPDVRTLPPFDLRLVVDRKTGDRAIRFSNSIWNSGKGVLELRGSYDRQNSRVEVTQHLYGADQELLKQSVGEFEYHPVHSHWHWQNFSVYKIWAVQPDGKLGEIQVSSGKVGFCLLDTTRGDDELLESTGLPGLEIAERARYGGCSWRRQGISPGWIDTYFSYTAGQEMDISSLPNGIYALRSTVDPGGLIFETNKNNNTGVVYFSLYGDRLHVIGERLSDYLPPAELE